jgi:flagellar biosynthesis/type III secretory pathway M-ring protein FliF/YscJ
MEIVLALVVLALLAAFVVAPLRRRGPEPAESESPERADLEARKEALYRQIRDAQLDREQGKLSRADWERLDAELRREAIAVLKRIDAAGESPGTSV